MQKITLAIQTVYKCHIWDDSPILISTNAIPFFNSHTLGPYWEPPPWMSDLTSPTHHKPQCTSERRGRTLGYGNNSYAGDDNCSPGSSPGQCGIGMQLYLKRTHGSWSSILLEFTARWCFWAARNTTQSQVHCKSTTCMSEIGSLSRFIKVIYDLYGSDSKIIPILNFC